MADSDYGSGQSSDFRTPSNAYSQGVMADFGAQPQAAFNPQNSTARSEDEVRIPSESPPEEDVQSVPAAPTYRVQEHIHDAFLAEQLKHFEYSKLIPRRQSNKYVREALSGPVSDAHREVLAQSMREAPLLAENAPAPSKTKPSGPPAVTAYKTGNTRLTDAEYLHELTHNSTAALAAKFQCTAVALSYRKTRMLERESARRSVDAEEIAREIDAARVANGVLPARAARSNNARRVGKASSKGRNVEEEDSNDAASGNSGDVAGGEVQAAEADNMEVGGSDTADPTSELAGRNLGGLQSWAPTYRTPQEIHEKMMVSAMLNPADEIELD